MAQIKVLFLGCVALSALSVTLGYEFDVTNFGAVGDGEADDTQAFLKAWAATCGATGGHSALIVPAEKTFFLNRLTFSGPCNSSAIYAQINGNLVAPSSRNAWGNCGSDSWIVFSKVNNLTVQGSGTLDARGSIWWDEVKATEDNVLDFPSRGGCDKPTTFRLCSCNSATLTGLHFLNSGRNHISVINCNDLNIFKINITAPENSPNTDGINLIGSRNVIIRDSTIGTGDDCIAVSNNCFNFNISGITCGPGHGISVGSLGRDGSSAAVDGIFVRNCTFIGTMYSARIKTWPGGSGYARNIFYDDLTLDSVSSAIEINQYYSNTINQSSDSVQVSNIHFTNVHGSGKLVKLDCSTDAPCRDIFVEQVNVTSCQYGEKIDITCSNVKLISSKVTPKLLC